MIQKLLRNLPKVDAAVDMMRRREPVEERRVPVLTDAVRSVLEELRRAILSGEVQSLPDEDELAAGILAEFHLREQRSLRPVINATGITLHTNLGRSVLSEEAAKAAMEAARAYSTLEYRIKEGKRGSRYDHVEPLLRKLCGCESALVVNNNAAAVMLVLNTMAKGRSVVISRGELIEIGGSFRIPEIMEMSGCHLAEVGTTNKTHPSDYERAIGEDTALLLKVHTSNFKITGFSEDVSLEEISGIAKKAELPVVFDMGSGSLVSMKRLAGVEEPNAAEALRAGADVVCFSGDKLLGGPQTGIIVGKKLFIDAMKKNPLTRALRVDKMTLAALEATLRQYAEGNAWETIPTLRMLSMDSEELRGKSETLCGYLSRIPGFAVCETEEAAPAGGGSIPGILFPTRCVAVSCEGLSADELEYRLRMLPHPIVARIRSDQVLLDVRTIQEDELRAVEEGFCLLGEELRSEREDT